MTVRSTQTLILSPNGHVEQHWQVTELGGRIWLDVDPGRSPDALTYLDKMRFLQAGQNRPTCRRSSAC